MEISSPEATVLTNQSHCLHMCGIGQISFSCSNFHNYFSPLDWTSPIYRGQSTNLWRNCDNAVLLWTLLQHDNDMSCTGSLSVFLLIRIQFCGDQVVSAPSVGSYLRAAASTAVLALQNGHASCRGHFLSHPSNFRRSNKMTSKSFFFVNHAHLSSNFFFT